MAANLDSMAVVAAAAAPASDDSAQGDAPTASERWAIVKKKFLSESMSVALLRYVATNMTSMTFCKLD